MQSTMLCYLATKQHVVLTKNGGSGMSYFPKVLVSILNYNSYENTIETIKCYQQQIYPNFHLQIIDNASTDNCVSKLKTIFPKLDIICLKENLGYVGGNNYALEMCMRGGYDFVIVSNEDIMIEREFIANIIETAKKNDSVGVIGGVEINYYTGEIKAAGGYGFNFWVGRQKWQKLVEPTSDCAIEVDYVQGAAVAFTRIAIESGVRFDNNMFIYLDEIDIGFQLKDRNLKAYVDPHCLVRHKCRPERFNPKTGYLIQRNRIYLTRKLAPFYVYMFNVLYTGFLELPAKVFLRSLQGQFYFSRCCVMGYIDGVLNNMSAGRCLSL